MDACLLLSAGSTIFSLIMLIAWSRSGIISKSDMQAFSYYPDLFKKLEIELPWWEHTPERRKYHMFVFIENLLLFLFILFEIRRFPFWDITIIKASFFILFVLMIGVSIFSLIDVNGGYSGNGAKKSTDIIAYNLYAIAASKQSANVENSLTNNDVEGMFVLLNHYRKAEQLYMCSKLPLILSFICLFLFFCVK